VQTGSCAPLVQPAHLAQAAGVEELAAEAWLHRHHQQQVDLCQMGQQRLQRPAAVDSHPGSTAQLPDRGQSGRQIRCSILLHNDHLCGGKEWQHGIRVLDFQMGVQRQRSDPAQIGECLGAERVVGHVVAVHDVDVQRIGAAPLGCLHSRCQVGGVCSQNRWAQVDHGHSLLYWRATWRVVAWIRSCTRP
jgi:hypothetical protein